MMNLQFVQLNNSWNADPNDPDEVISCEGEILKLSFLLNSFEFDFPEGSSGQIDFENCSQWRLGKTNDEGWYRGQCRYSGLAPAWGEFYEILGDDLLAMRATDWRSANGSGTRHFLFYFKDSTFECFASDFQLEIGGGTTHPAAPATPPAT